MAHSVCPAKRAWMLDTPVRSLLIRPSRLLAPFVKPGITALDLGCGPGFFTKPMARMAGPAGTVIAADLQHEMLNLTRAKLTRKGLINQVRLHQTTPDSLGLSEREIIDFTLAFHVMHEVLHPKTLFSEVFAVMKSGGIFLMSEPKGHVKKNEYESELSYAKSAGFLIEKEQHGWMEYQVILRKP